MFDSFYEFLARLGLDLYLFYFLLADPGPPGEDDIVPQEAAIQRLLDEFKDRLPPAVVHCFTGTEEEVRKLFAMG